MNEIMEKTYLLLDELDNSDIIKNIGIYKDRIMKNKEIRDLVDRGNNTIDEYVIRDIKKKLYEYDDYKNYMDNYNQLMYIVMDINNRFRKLISNKGCMKV
jgi:hypothetical protein